MYTPKMWWYERPRFRMLRMRYCNLRFIERVLTKDPHYDYLELTPGDCESLIQDAKESLRWEIHNLIGYTCRWIMRPITVNLSLLAQSLRAIPDARVTKLA